ncbi:Levodione reductase [Fonsecaea pedrosoi]|nr:Levodione reductase [Fonsecaea pedrosoi]
MSPSKQWVLPSGVAFVTGGARGLGKAVALSFAREGCRGVTIVDVLPDDVLEATKQEVIKEGAKCLAIRCDVTDEAQVEKAVEATVAEFGRLDYAANAAGVAGPLGFTTAVDAAAFDKCLKINTLGVFICMKFQLRQMEKQQPLTLEGRRVPQRGAIVNFASVNSIMSGSTTVAYTASKHAVYGMTKTAALEYRQKNIRVNALSPGFVYTSMAATDGSLGDPRLAEAWAGFEARQGRTAWPEEIGDAVALLCSPKMSLVNAQNLVCDK